ncbi:hypothetical protein DH2020_037979 [Rehmannia glutinosa]|uniref:C2 NT-type domain-containing protein n=1 Tax=Rehmannia glutinosa TaxID=99300 RepID=A0ABR0V149_REHGL
MVQGLRTKTRKSPSVQLDYIIHVQEIKPWPPSQSLRTIRAVLIQWEHGDRNSGLTNQVVPSIGTGPGVTDGKIEFNESFRIPVILMRDMSVKSGGVNTFQKNCIEFNLYEPRRDKTVKGQLIGTAVLDWAEYGVVKESLCISVPINCKRTYWNSAQPLLFLKIQSIEKTRASSSSRDSLTREASMDRNTFESVSALSEEYVEEAEVSSFTTDDDVSSQSSVAVTSAAAESNGSSSPQNKENGPVAMNGSAGEAKSDEDQVTESHVKSERGSSRSSSVDLSSDLAWISKRIYSPNLQSSAMEDIEKQQSPNHKVNQREAEGVRENVANGDRDVKIQRDYKEGTLTSPFAKETLAHSDHQRDDRKEDSDSGRINSPQSGLIDDETRQKHTKYSKERRIMEEKEKHTENEPLGGCSQVDVHKQVTLDNCVANGTFSNIDRSKHGRSVRSSADLSRSNGPVRSNQVYMLDTPSHARGSLSSECKDAKIYTKEPKNLHSDSRIQHLEHRMKILEGELSEAAAIEVSLYSVIAEHGSSMTKVHAPARRLSRLYFHASKQNSKSRRGSAAKSIVSGLALVSKACGNDVPRLTFWLSNSIVLRVIMSKSYGDGKLPVSVGPVTGTAGEKNGEKKSAPLKWESFPSKSTRSAIEESFGDWENPLTFIDALEKVEAWIFSRIVESIWWQSGNAKDFHSSLDSESSILYHRTSSSINQQQGNFSLELWKKAFRDACERICPVRAGGHDCGCLPVLSRVIMEQLIARLDLAMFNAILRESADEIPTDPIADPISDAEVLPIPAGKASFGAGAQLKNAIGNWSRWLTDLFGIDDDDLLEDADEIISHDTSSKSFHLLNALSDLMMLPKDLLLSRTVRKEVCPTFGPQIIRRVLNSFNPDEFCPDPVPAVDSFDSEDDAIMNFPCAAAPIEYQPPSAASVASFLGEIGIHSQLTRSRSAILKKSQTSDDELDELDSPLKSIILDSLKASPSSVRPDWISKENGSRNALRYQLLRDIWMDSD